MEYIARVILCSGFLSILYLLLLEREQMHRFKRAYLLAAVALALLIPLAVISRTIEYVPALPATISGIQPAGPAAEKNIFFEPQSMPAFRVLPGLLLFLYGMITLVLAVRFVKNMAGIFKMVQQHEKIQLQHAVLVLTDTAPVPFSFSRYIFVNKDAWNSGMITPQVIQHESTHVRQLHSVDIVLAELLLVFCWINPFFFLLRKQIKTNHEFLADEGVLTHCDNLAAYQYLLVENAMPVRHTALTSPFNYLTIKKRIKMMTTQTSRKAKITKQLCAATGIAVAVFLFGDRAYTQEIKPNSGTNGQTKNYADTSNPGSKAIVTPFADNLPAGPGVNSEMVNEYENIVSKYKTTEDKKWQRDFFGKVTETDKSRLETIFLQMNKEQRSGQIVVFRAPFPPFSKAVPATQQYQSFKNAAVYGVWIDGKKVPNSELDKYTNTDFSHFFVSKLNGYARKGKNYTHQLDLMTRDYYRNYYNKTISNKKNMMAIIWSNKKGEQ